MYQVIDTLTGWWNFNGLRPVSASIVKDVNTVSSGRRARADTPRVFLYAPPTHHTNIDRHTHAPWRRARALPHLR